MSRKFYILVLLWASILGRVSAQQTVSSTCIVSGDSARFIVNSAMPVGSSVLIAVNCFSDCFVPYSEPVLLYRNSYVPNTWEDQPFTKEPVAPDFVVDPFAGRGPIRRFNVVRVRTVDDVGGILSDDIHFVSLLGEDDPHQVKVVNIYVDSLDAFGPEGFYGPGQGLVLPSVAPYVEEETLWNYDLKWSEHRVKTQVARERIEKAAFVHIMDGMTGNVHLAKHVGIRLSGSLSRQLPNKSMQIVARNQFSSGNISTDLFGQQESFKFLRLRSGGSGQQSTFGDNEIGLGIMEGLTLGEMMVEPVVVYLNGSFWSYAFIQEKLDQYLPSRYFGVHQSIVDIVRPVDFGEFNNDMLSDSNFGLVLDTSRVVHAPSPWADDDSQRVFVGYVEEGSKARFTPVAEVLIEAIDMDDEWQQYVLLDSVVDLLSWLKYLSVTDFLQCMDYLDNNVFIGMHEGEKPYLLAKDFDDMWGLTDWGIGFDPWANHWEHTIDPERMRETFLVVILRELILKNSYTIEWLMRVYQDLLNTNFLPSTTVAVVRDIYSDQFFHEFPGHYASWGGYPNGGVVAPEDYMLWKSRIEEYLNDRPEGAAQVLADQWRPQAGMTVSNRSLVTVDMSHLPEGSVRVQLNSLSIDTTWQGLYFPEPTLKVQMIPLGADLDGAELKWLEFPDSSMSMELSALNDITLTPVMGLITDVGDHVAWGKSSLRVYPNPASTTFKIAGSHSSCTLFDITGKPVQEGIIENGGLEGLANGVFILSCRTEAGPVVLRVVKQ